MLDKGVRWRIGNGSSIKIWSDAWLGGEGSGRIYSPPSKLPIEASVRELLDPSSKCWKKEVLRETFLPIDVDRILSVPISLEDKEDERVWMGNKDDIFKVKDAYRIAHSSQSFASSSIGPDPVWKKLWKLNIPLKAKIFLWRAVWNIIPHNENLKKKRILDTSDCSRCGDHESSLHAFRDCSWARSLWKLAPASLRKQEALSIRDWISDVILYASSSEADFFATLLWQMWYSRNEYCFEHIQTSPEACFQRSKETLHDYHRWNGFSHQDKSHREVSKWCKPRRGDIKINFDAALNCSQKCTGLGVVARDGEGNILLSAARTVAAKSEAELAEIEAAGWAVRLAVEYDWDNIPIEGDARLVIEALNQNRARGFYAQTLINNIRFMSSAISSISFSFCFRESNEVAHRLAHWASRRNCNSVWTRS